jgi:hypothetical protein
MFVSFSLLIDLAYPQILNIEAVSSETSVNYRTTRRYISENSTLYPTTRLFDFLNSCDNSSFIIRMLRWTVSIVLAIFGTDAV